MAWGGGCCSWRVIVGKKNRHASVLTWKSVSNSTGMDFQHSLVDHISPSPYLLYGGDFASSPHPYPLHGKEWCSIMSSTTEVCLPFGYSSLPYSLCTITNLASRPNLYLFTSTSISLLSMALSHYIIYLSFPNIHSEPSITSLTSCSSLVVLPMLSFWYLICFYLNGPSDAQSFHLSVVVKPFIHCQW